MESIETEVVEAGRKRDERGRRIVSAAERERLANMDQNRDELMALLAEAETYGPTSAPNGGPAGARSS